MRCLSLVAAAGAVLGTAGVAMAQAAPTADQLHRQGLDRAKAWFQKRDRAALEEAAALFKQALALGDSPLIECDLGLALHYLGEDSRADARLNSCVPRVAASADVSAEKVDGYRKVASDVARAVATGHVAVDIATTPAGAAISISSFPADETVLAPTLIWLVPGSYTLTAHVDGHVDVSTTVEITDADVKARQRKTWRGKLEPKAAEVVPGGGGDIVEPEKQPPPVHVDPPRPRSKKSAYVTLGVGGALLVGGGVVNLMSMDKRDHLDTLAGPGHTQAEYDAYLPTWQKWQRATIGLYASGAVVTGIGVWLYLRARTPAPIAVSPTPEGDGAMVWVFSRSP